MATRTVNHHAPSPFSRLSRLGIGLGLITKAPSPMTSSPMHEKDGKRRDDDEWYIAYNGPYEVPQDTRKRDSWGDIVEDDQDEERDAILDADLLQRYGGFGRGNVRNSDGTNTDSRSSGAGSKTRGRAASGASRTTAGSSGAFDSGGRSARSNYSTAHSSHPNMAYTATRRTASSGFASLDAGGIGESPIPRQRSPTPNSNTRSSLAGLFFGPPASAPPSTSGTFGAQKRGGSHERSTGNITQSPKNRHGRRRSTSLDPPKERRKPAPIVPPSASKDDDYFNSYYSTLITSPASHHTFGPHARGTGQHHPQLSKTSTDGGLTGHPRANLHPYAYTFPPRAGEPSTSTAPPPPLTPIPMSRSITSPAPTLKTLNTPNDAGPASDLNGRRPHTAIGPKPSIPKLSQMRLGLKNSISVPNLQSKQHEKASMQSHIPSGVDRWLSAETWCDAMLFPRPRFKVKQSLYSPSEPRASGSGSGSGRIVSPPLTPSHDHGGSGSAMQERREQTLHPESSRPLFRRKLSKSRSAVSLRSVVPDVATSVPAVHRLKASNATQIATSDGSGLKGKAKMQGPRPQEVVLDDNVSLVAPSLDRSVLISLCLC